jgi:hypothetical protein
MGVIELYGQFSREQRWHLPSVQSGTIEDANRAPSEVAITVNFQYPWGFKHLLRARRLSDFVKDRSSRQELIPTSHALFLLLASNWVFHSIRSRHKLSRVIPLGIRLVFEVV